MRRAATRQEIRDRKRTEEVQRSLNDEKSCSTKEDLLKIRTSDEKRSVMKQLGIAEMNQVQQCSSASSAAAATATNAPLSTSHRNSSNSRKLHCKVTSPLFRCVVMASEWEERQRLRAEEWVTIHDTIDSLNDDDELELFQTLLAEPILAAWTEEH